MPSQSIESTDKPKAASSEQGAELAANIWSNATLPEMQALYAPPTANLAPGILPDLILVDDNMQPIGGTDSTAASLLKTGGQLNDQASQKSSAGNTDANTNNAGSNTLLKGEVSKSTFANIVQDGKEIASGVADGVVDSVTGMVKGGIAVAKVAVDVANIPSQIGDIAVNSIVDPPKAAMEINDAENKADRVATIGKNLVHVASTAYEATVNYASNIEQTGDYDKVAVDLGNEVSTAYKNWDSQPLEGKAKSLTTLGINVAGLFAGGEALGLGKAAEATEVVGQGAEAASAVTDVSTLSAQTGSAAQADSALAATGNAMGDSTNAQELIKPSDMDSTNSDGLADNTAGAKSSESSNELNKRPSPDVVQQCHGNACVSAAGEMATNGAIDQNTLVEELDKYLPPEMQGQQRPAALQNLAKVLSEKVGLGWKFNAGVEVGQEVSELNRLMSSGYPWVADLREPGQIGHAVVIDGFNDAGEIMIRDPADAMRYEMTVAKFLKIWSTASVYHE